MPDRPSTICGAVSQRLCLFLDIDGVLHPTDNELVGVDRGTEQKRVQLVRGERHPRDFGLLRPDRQALLVAVLQDNRHVDLVISSAWRSWEGYNYLDPSEQEDPVFEARHVHSLDWLKRVLHPVISSRIIGRTAFEESRLDEIQAFVDDLDRRQYARSWVALDDQVAHFPPERVAAFFDQHAGGTAPDWAVDPAAVVVVVDGRQALTPLAARMLSAAIAHASVLCESGSTGAVLLARQRCDQISAR